MTCLVQCTCISQCYFEVSNLTLQLSIAKISRLPRDVPPILVALLEAPLLGEVEVEVEEVR